MIAWRSGYGWYFRTKENGTCSDGTLADQTWRLDEGDIRINALVTEDLARKRQSPTVRRRNEIVEHLRVMCATDRSLWDMDDYTIADASGEIIELGVASGVTPVRDYFNHVTLRLGSTAENAEPTRWLQFLNETLPDDEKVREWFNSLSRQSANRFDQGRKASSPNGPGRNRQDNSATRVARVSRR